MGVGDYHPRPVNSIIRGVIMDTHWRSLPPKDIKGKITWRDLQIPQDYYERLGVTRTANPEAIKRAYRALIDKFHPDKHPPNNSDWVEEVAKELNIAYTILSDPEKRAEYDMRKGFRG